MRHIIKAETFDKIVSLERYEPRAIGFLLAFPEATHARRQNNGSDRKSVHLQNLELTLRYEDFDGNE
jgi:hypothetical protein